MEIPQLFLMNSQSGWFYFSILLTCSRESMLKELRLTSKEMKLEISFDFWVIASESLGWQELFLFVVWLHSSGLIF